MATFRTHHAGREFAFITSNSGIRVEIDGVETYKSWSDEINVTPDTIGAALEDSDNGDTLILGPGQYELTTNAEDGKALALKAHNGTFTALFNVE